MYIEQDPVPVVEGFGQKRMARKPLHGFGEALPTPWYMKPEAVTTFLSALQVNLGVPQTGVWDKPTHDALWNWVMAREAMTSTGGVSDMPAVLPWKQQICDADGFPVSAEQTERAKSTGEAVTGCMDTTDLIGESLDHYAEESPAMLAALGWPSENAMHEDTLWGQHKANFATNLVAHIRSRLGVSQEPCPEGQWRSADGTCVPLVTVTPVTPAKPWYKSTGVMVAGAGAVVLAGVLIAVAVSRRRG
jgi:hypothetical protein